MKIIWAMPILTLLLVVTMFSYKHVLSNSTPHIQPLSLGLQEFVYEDTSRIFEGKPRRLEVAVWYPTNHIDPQEQIQTTVWKIQQVVRDAPVAGDQLPLILFSHGYGGNQWSNSWFAERLVQHGYIVASVRHYGNSACTMIPELSVRAWNRAQDMSFVLDHLLQDPELGHHIDQNNIGAAGFSQGGITALWLAGIQADLTPAILHNQITALSDPEWRDEHFADIPAERLDAILDQFTAQDFEDANRSYCDPRIKAVFAMAPALDAKNIMFTDAGLAKGAVPTCIVVGQADTECAPQAHCFAQHIPNSLLTIIPGHVGHLTLLNEGIEPSNTVYTTDHPSVNRGHVHDTIAAQAVNFFDQYLKNARIRKD